MHDITLAFAQRPLDVDLQRVSFLPGAFALLLLGSVLLVPGVAVFALAFALLFHRFAGRRRISELLVQS